MNLFDHQNNKRKKRALLNKMQYNAYDKKIPKICATGSC